MSEKCPEEQQPDQIPDEQEMLILTAEESVWFMNLLKRPARHRELFGE